MPEESWRPELVALDIDGTLLRWSHTGASHSEVTAAVYDAVGRVFDAGCHLVLASGRSPLGMAAIADELDLQRRAPERVWMVASNGAIVLRYPPMDVIHEETFDASKAVPAVLEHHPNALVAVEERGVGYRVNRTFPEGELNGELIVSDVADIVAEPVSRVIIRDPGATAEDFVELGRKLGLHGTDYVVGWTAWMDLSPVGISKAFGLAYVAEELGVDATDVLALGDGRNDVEMLQWAGRGVAMGQAVPEVQDAADAVAPSVDDDGAAVELDRWFGRGA